MKNKSIASENRVIRNIVTKNADFQVEISHYDDVDIIVDGKIGVEYERPGSHTFDEICQKRDAALAKYSEVFFVCQAQNYEQISKAVGEERTIQRGKDL